MPESEKEKEEEEDLLEEEKKRRGGWRKRHPSEGRVQMCSYRFQKDKREKVMYLK